MSTTMTISNTTTTSIKINWADDDSDDFDFEAWKVTADISAPSIGSLPPLQIPVNESEDEPFYTSTTNTTAPWTTNEPTRDEYKLALETTDWRCGASTLAWRATSKVPDRPAYVEMSAWDNGVICAWNRVQYSRNWKCWKVGAGADCRRTAQFRSTTLKEVDTHEVDEVEVDVASTTAPVIPPLTIIVDEGYYSDTSSLDSPTFRFCTSQEDVDIPVSTTQIGLGTATKFVRHRRVDSQNALKKITKAREADSDGGVVVEESQHIVFDVSGGEDETLENISTRAATKDWYYTWTTAALITTGIILSGSMYLMRKR
jgi:hypothetical protein